MSSFDRRRFLKTSASSAGAAAALAMMPESIRRALAIPANNQTGTIRDVEHIVVFMQENRSFDHYYGHLRGVRGYNDRFPITLPNGNPVWFQPSKENTATPVLPFRLNTQTTSAMCVGDLDHSWYPTHYAINGGKYDQWPANKTDMTMGYYVREDIPFHYALADAFTVCDHYFCSLPGPTHPNRMYLMTGWVDPTGKYGGPLLDNNDAVDGDVPPTWALLSWTTYPERLQAAGISWQVYQQGVNGNDPVNGNYGTNALPNFVQFINAPATSPLTLRGNSVRTIAQLKADVQANQLPQVSWLLPPAVYSEHPKYTPAYGAEYTSQILDALTSNPEVWSKTVLFIMYDENDGFFDHLVPPQPPLSSTQGASTVGFSDEIHTVVNPLRGGSYTDDGLPYGLGPRVPMTVVSPWSKGGFVNSQVFDHTSVIRFIEARFGVGEPNISNWRRTVSGDLTSAFDFRSPDASFPTLPDTSNYLTESDASCLLPAPTVPATPSTTTIEAQEPGIRPARPLPYELHANGQVEESQKFAIQLANTGEWGAHFYIYSTNRTDGPWSYTVGAGKKLKAEFDVSSTSGVYAFTVHGPNGFVRQFEGTVPANGTSQKTAQPEVKVGYDVANGNLYLTITNAGRASVKLTVTDNAYGAAARHFVLPSEGFVEAPWQLQSSYHWYDLTVSDGNGFVRRVAGHVENGRASYSDPAATQPVTTEVASVETAAETLRV
ncbi:phosphocholine-specific phospholipase C [Pararobbsia silviterrae]|uniref:phospholipase C n=1 Tax=Pararobbsia silviterrae TaxID=1792498 RepID=A0A494X6E5_9BURK|nr:phospholipase C, phosphocholine-specific [Pararobbsia silviterrae]RKP46228.1 phospholipase C, phosphocholine-specific [Pararobbsia silviterrae]